MCFVCMIITSEQRVREWERDLNNGHIIFIRVRLLVSECQINWSIFIPYDCVIIMLYRNMEMGSRSPNMCMDEANTAEKYNS